MHASLKDNEHAVFSLDIFSDMKIYAALTHPLTDRLAFITASSDASGTVRSKLRNAVWGMFMRKHLKRALPIKVMHGEVKGAKVMWRSALIM